MDSKEHSGTYFNFLGFAQLWAASQGNNFVVLLSCLVIGFKYHKIEIWKSFQKFHGQLIQKLATDFNGDGQDASFGV